MAAAAEQDECTRHALAASEAESEAIALDRSGNFPAAIKRYEECERELAAAISAAAPIHAADQPALAQHRQEVLLRISYLASLESNVVTAVPVEEHINSVQLGMQTPSFGLKTVAACAALGAAGGFIVLGGAIGSVLSVVGGAAGAAYVATRNDKLGEAARGAGNMAVAGAEKVKKINDEHQITGKLAEAGSKAVTAAKAANEEHQITTRLAEAGSKAVTAAKTMDEKYKLSDKVVQGVGSVITKVQEVDQKHKVTDKVVAGVAKGLSKLTTTLDGAASSSSAGPSAAAAGK